MHNRIAAVIEQWLEAPEILLGSLQATNRFGQELEQVCRDTPLDGLAIRTQWIPFRHGMLPIDDFNLRRLALILREDSTFTLANLHIAGSTGHDLAKASKAIPGCVLSYQLMGALFTDDLGI